MEQKTINIFLASSSELKNDRESFRGFVNSLDNSFLKMGRQLKPQLWEDLDVTWKGHPEQLEYDKLIRSSDIFIALFHTVGGEYTIQEFEVAIEEFYRNKKSPKVYVYMKALRKGEKIDSKLERFQKKLEEMGLYWTTYSSQDSLHFHFLQQLLIVYADGLSNLKVEDGTVKFGDMDVAEMSNLSFVADNKDYQLISAELNTLPHEIERARKFLDEHPDNEYLQGELQKKLNRYNNKKEEFARLQQALFDMSQRIAMMQREDLSDKLRCATEAFESGNLAGTNALLDEIVREMETHLANLEESRELVHQDIEAFLLQAKTKMAEVNTPIEERIEEVHAIYAKADQWAKDSVLPEDKLDGLLDDYSGFLFDYGKYKEAEPVYLRLVSLREKMLGKEHPDTANTYNDIGKTYHRLGDYPKALEYCFKALKTKENVFGEEHPDTATTYNTIGTIYHSQGDYPKALDYFHRALGIHENVLGKKHPDTATSYNNIGSVYDSQGDYPKALEYYQKALDIKENVLGKEHPSTATSYNNIGLTYHYLGDYPKALRYILKAQDIFEKVLGKEHPDTAMTYNNFGMTHDSQGDYPKALEYYQKALDIREKVLGMEHPDTATTYNNIGTVYYNQGDYSKALEYYHKALYIREKVLGIDHPYTTMSYSNIGAVYDKQSNKSEALKYYNKALKVKKRTVDSSLLETENTGLNINADNHSILLYKEILDNSVKNNGFNHPNTKNQRVNICHILLEWE